MDPARWECVQALFHRCVDLDESARASLLDCECAGDPTLSDEVRRMLDEDRRANLLDREVTGVANDLLGGSRPPSFPNSSPYRIQRVLGEGGMGIVYLAERVDLGNLVAIKVLRDGWLSPGRRSRFAAEQRVLAQLNHPSIARLYDANTLADGTPWFVMEYVDGVPLTEYCRLRNLTAHDRLRLLGAVAEAVRYAHERGVAHRDLKPSNILVKADGSVRLLDFGIAKQLDENDPATQTQTQFRAMTPAYASPEQLRGEAAGASADVYSLGVILYELLAGQLPFDLRNKTASEAEALVSTTEPENPSSVARRTGWTAGDSHLDALCLTAMERDRERRYPSAAAFLAEIDRYLKGEPLDARRGFRRSLVGVFVRRRKRFLTVLAAGLVLIFAAAAATLALAKRTAVVPAHPRTVAVLPFQNLGGDHELDFLRQALADEIWRTLSNAPSLSLRPAEAGRKYIGSDRDAGKAGRELRVGAVASGQFLKTGNQLQITMELIDAANNRMVWSDVFDVPAGNMVAMQAQVAAKTRRAMAPALGATEFVSEHTPAPTPAPKNEEAYQLYLQAAALPDAISADPAISGRAIAMLKESLAIDPSYAPAWQGLAGRVQAKVWWGRAGVDEPALVNEAYQRALALDPDNVVWQAGWLYQSGSPGFAGKPGAITRGAAYLGLKAILQRRPDLSRVHFMQSWILRDVGLLDEAGRECDASILIDALDSGARSCGVVFLLRGDYARARDYLDLDPASEVSKAMTIDILLREARPRDAVRAMQSYLPQWAGYGMLQAYLERKAANATAALARQLQTSDDPEINYFSAAHLAYAGQTDAALDMLQRTVDGGYCSFPAAATDPMFAGVRAAPRFAAIAAAGATCQERFQKERAAAR